jgi:predicted Zn-ribbon and HTH transcriptional regulator
MGLRRGDVEEDLRHALRTAEAAGHRIEIIPARCKSCDFTFDSDRLVKPGRCPVCKGSRLFEALIRIEDPGSA